MGRRGTGHERGGGMGDPVHSLAKLILDPFMETTKKLKIGNMGHYWLNADHFCNVVYT
jgi:hypothetical protein